MADCPEVTMIATTPQDGYSSTRTTLKVTLLGDEWNSSAGGLSTLNRELAIHLSEHPKVDVTLLVPEGACKYEEKREAKQRYGITIAEAKKCPGYDPLDWLSFPPKDLNMDVVVGHGAKLGRQVQVIRNSARFNNNNCHWVQVVHTAPEDLSKYKSYAEPISKGERKHQDEVELCKLADLVVPVGPRLEEFYSSYLRRCRKDQHVFSITPGLFGRDFCDLEQFPNESADFKVLIFGRGDDEDFKLKGYDIAAEAFTDQRLKQKPYHLIFVGAADGKQEEVRQKLVQCGIAEEQLTVRKFIQSRDRMKDLLCEADLAIMPSKSEGFGLVALEALSAGLPILVGSKSGFAKALENVPIGHSCIVYSDDPSEWAKAIETVRVRHRMRLKEIKALRASYQTTYCWKEQCEALVERIWRMVYEPSVGLQDVVEEQPFAGSGVLDAVKKPCSVQQHWNIEEKEVSGTNEDATTLSKNSCKRSRTIAESNFDSGPSNSHLKTASVEFFAEQQLHVPLEKKPQPKKRGFGTNEEGASFSSTVIKHSYPDLSTKKLETVREILIQQIEVYMTHHDVSTDNGVGGLIEHFKEAYSLALKSVGLSSLVIEVQCPTLESLESLWNDYCSGHLNEVAERYLVTDEIKKKLDLETVKLKTTIEEENFLICKKALMEKTYSFSPEQSAIRSNDIASGWSGASGSSKQVHCDQAYPVKPFDVKTCRSELAEHYKTRANVPTCVWSSAYPVKLDQIHTRLSWVKKEQTPTGSSESKLAHYSDLFKEDANGDVPKRILVQGQTGIGKTTFVKKLAVDWAQLVDEKTGDEQATTLRKYENNEGREDVIEARNKKGIQDDEDTSSEDEDTLCEDDECTSHEKRENTNGNRSDVLRKFELLLLVTLKEVSSCQTWKEVINGSRLFPKDKEFSTDDLCSYVHNNEKRVLLVFDGFDEYRIGSEAEAKRFCSRSNSPICEIFHGDYLRGCTVLVTSRSSEAVELQGSADKHAEITGFDEKDQVAFMRKMLDSDVQVEDLFVFLRKKKMLDLARVPLLNLFFCLLWRQEKQKLMELTKGKTKLYQAIIRHILLYCHKSHFPEQVSKVNEENYHKILNEIGKVALESLLMGYQVFEYGQVSEKVRGEKSLIADLLQLSEFGASLEPMEIVSFIHKSIQEYLAAWHINNECVSADNLGRIEEHARTLEDCETLENVFQFICGLSSEGAVKVFKHLSTVRGSDPLLDLSKTVPDEESENTVLVFALWKVTRRQQRFNDLVLNCFREVSTEAELVKHLFDCLGGIVLLQNEALGPELLPKPEVLIQAAHPWAFLFDVFDEEHLYKSMKYLSLCNTPLGINESSEVLKQGDFVTKFRDIQCKKCGFSSILCCRDGQIQYYIRELWLECDAHNRVFTEAAAAISIQSLSANLCSNQSCLNFLTHLNYMIDPNGELTKHAVAIIRNFKHLKDIGLDGNFDYLCDLLEQVPNSGRYNLEIGECGSWTMTSPVADRFAALLPRIPNISALRVDLRDCCAESVTKLVTNLPHEIRFLQMKNISFSPEAAEALGRVLPEMTSLSDLSIHGKNGSILRAKEMEALFAGFNKTMYNLVLLNFMNFRVRGNLGPLMKSLRFFPNLNLLRLEKLDMDGDGLCLLLDSFRFIRNLATLRLAGNPLGQAVRYIVPHLTNLPKLKYLSIDNTGCSEEDLNYVRKTAAIELVPAYTE